MSFNGIGGYLSKPGEIPWELIVLYFVVALGIAFALGKRSGGLRMFSTMDLVYIGVGAALAVVWEFYIGAFIGRAMPRGFSTFVGIPFLGRMFITFVTVALVRKVGVGMISLAIFNILGDIFFYGFSGEPIFTLYEALTYGLLLDVGVAVTGGNIFGVKGRMSKSMASPPTASNAGVSMAAPANVAPAPVGRMSLGISPTVLAVVEGAILGFAWSFPEGLFYTAFFGPLVYGSTVNWAKIILGIVDFVPATTVVGILAGLASRRISKAV